MATLLEMRQLYAESDLMNRIEASVCIAANTIKNESTGVANHAERLVWAKSAIANTRSEADKILKILLAENAGATVSQIVNANDSTINTAVANAVNFFAV